MDLRINPHELILIGENSFVRLSPDGGKTQTDRFSHWRVLWCPAGAGHALFAQSQQMGALPILYAATRPEIKGGEYASPDGFLGQRGYPYLGFSSPLSHNKALARRLWEVSSALTGL